MYSADVKLPALSSHSLSLLSSYSFTVDNSNIDGSMSGDDIITKATQDIVLAAGTTNSTTATASSANSMQAVANRVITNTLKQHRQHLEQHNK